MFFHQICREKNLRECLSLNLAYLKSTLDFLCSRVNILSDPDLLYKLEAFLPTSIIIIFTCSYMLRMPTRWKTQIQSY